uniref:MAPK regulated corepressor interacting protein 2 n=1 Tax=Oncorhynchus tshawytscha TaxID=74940 RepID=A0AAZ3PDZ5_ONCTS
PTWEVYRTLQSAILKLTRILLAHDVHNYKRSQQTCHTATNSSPAPKIVFNRLNGKKYHNTPAALLQVDPQPNEGFTSAHQENVKFIYEAWQEVVQLAEEGGASDETGSASAQGPVQYSDTNPSPNPALKNFVPIDLDEWWAQRFLANIDNLS